MGGVSIRRDFQSYMQSKPCLTEKTITAGGGQDGVYQDDAVIIDRQSLDNPLSIAVMVPVVATLASGKTATIQAKVMHSDESGGTYTDFVESDEVVIDDSESTNNVMAQMGIDISGAKPFIKVLAKATMSATSTDTAVFTAVTVLEKGRNL